MRVRLEKERRGALLRIWNRAHCEFAYVAFRLSGPELAIEFPSDWHEHRRVWIRFGIIVAKIAFSLPWPTTVPDEGQCQGPQYGFNYHSDALWLYYGKTKGTRGDPVTVIHMPWDWKHVRHDYLNPDGSLHHAAQAHEYTAPAETKLIFPYTYVLRSGEAQHRIATVYGEEREWRWRWFTRFPWPRIIRRSINVTFSEEVGERSGSWKGGVIGTGHDWRHGESMNAALRRMEREQEFT